MFVENNLSFNDHRLKNTRIHPHVFTLSVTVNAFIIPFHVIYAFYVSIPHGDILQKSTNYTAELSKGE